MADGPLQYTINHGEMSVWVMMPAANSEFVLRFDGRPVNFATINASRRDRLVARALLAEALDQLDRWEADHA